MAKRPRTPLLKPSGYDVVIRNTLAIKRINRGIGKADAASRERMIDEKDRLMREMWAACPHESVVYDPGMKTRLGPEPLPTRICTSCGFDESSPRKTFTVLGRRRGRQIVRLESQAFSVKLGEILRRTGINV